ncbi:protein IQ-domain 26-like [Rhododendron vialii]|uniref:protein IQ-domain 26-like n=1 Tax=Rhododendron vialii TaxID=182163 RepID=UPI00265F0AD8|nr:protein IQ-domain 26-like [Rhododendron vialii]
MKHPHRSASVRNRVPSPDSPKESDRRSPPRVPAVRPADHGVLESWMEQKKAFAVAAAAAELVGAVAYRRGRAVEEAAAVMIQSVFRSYLARKALKTLKGLVKVQALVRGYLVRKQTTATLHSMQLLATAQARARSQRIRMADESNSSHRIQSNHRKSTDRRSRQSSYDQEMDRGMDGNIRIVEMDVGESERSTNSRKSHSSHPQTAHTNHRPSKGPATNHAHSKQERRECLPVKPSALVSSSPISRSMRLDRDRYFDAAQGSPQYSSSAGSMPEYPSYGAQTYHRVFTNVAYAKHECQDTSLIQPSALGDSSLRAESGRSDDYYLDTDQSSPYGSSATSKLEYLSYDYSVMAPAYMENTEPSKAKLVRSLSAPRTGPGSIAGMLSRKKNPQAGTRPDSKLAGVGGSTGNERDYGASRTGHANTVNGKSRRTWKWK